VSVPAAGFARVDGSRVGGPFAGGCVRASARWSPSRPPRRHRRLRRSGTVFREAGRAADAGRQPQSCAASSCRV